MENTIRIISISSVKTASNEELTQCKRIELTSSDIRALLLAPIQKGLLLSKPKSSSEESNVSSQNLLQHLKNSLSRTLDFFFPLAGRLANIKHDDNTVSFFIDCNNVGAQFVHAIADKITISDILEPIYVPDVVHSFFPLNGMKNYEGISKPLLAVQVTELADGIFIGFTINHVAADGTTFWHFINSMSEISRGDNSNHIIISKPPVFEHWFRCGRYCPVSFPVSIIKTDEHYTPPPLQKRIFHFSKENIAKLKARANEEASCAEKMSSLQSLWAHVWRSLVRNQQFDPEEKMDFIFVIGLRSRLRDPPMAEEYFGNALHGVTVTMKSREIIENNNGFIALEMNKMIGHVKEENIRKEIENWIKDPKLTTLCSITGRNATVAANLPRFDVYGNDFGWGRPIAVRSGRANEFNRVVTVFPGREEASMDIEITIMPEILQAIGNDNEFMDAVTIS